jgi:hypothetical protein
VRLRALPLLLAMTTGDYALWDWSIADGHDVVSLVAGLTLIPLAAVSLAGLVLAGGRLVGVVFGSRAGKRARPRARTHARAGHASRATHTPEPPQGAAAASESEASSRSLAA